MPIDHEMRPHWDIRIKANSHLEEWNIYEDPLKMEKGQSTKVRHKICREMEWLTAEGKMKVDGFWTDVSILDKGPVLIALKGVNGFLFDFRGEHLKGTWILAQEDGTWTFMHAA